MKKVMATFVASLMACGLSLADTIVFEDFEDGTVTYSQSVADNLTDLAGENFHGRVADSAMPGGLSYGNVQGLSYYALSDSDDSGAATLVLTWSGIDVSTYVNLSISLFVAEDDDGTAQDWDADSSLLLEYQLDGGGYQNLFAVEAVGGTNTEPAQDTNFDGVGDGAAITDQFTQFTSAIGSTGSILDFRITVTALDAGDEDIAFDNVLLSGDVVPEPATFSLLGLGGLMLWFRRRIK